MDKITITGASGFVGSSLQKYLNSDFEVIPISIRHDSNQGIELSGKTIIHLSGISTDTRKTSNAGLYFNGNTKLTEHLFDLFLNSECRDFIFFSTVKVVSDRAINKVTEDTDTYPNSVYGESKLQAEKYILNNKVPPNKRVFIIRPSMIYGPGNKGNFKLLYSMVKKGIPWPFGAFDNKRTFCSIENVCFVVRQIIERSEIPSGVYNLSDDCALSSNELIEIISTSLNKKVCILPISKVLVTILARFGDFFPLPLNTERLHKLTESFIVDNSKIKNALQIENMPISTKIGLTQTIRSFDD